MRAWNKLKCRQSNIASHSHRHSHRHSHSHSHERGNLTQCQKVCTLRMRCAASSSYASRLVITSPCISRSFIRSFSSTCAEQKECVRPRSVRTMYIACCLLLQRQGEQVTWWSNAAMDSRDGGRVRLCALTPDFADAAPAWCPRLFVDLRRATTVCARPTVCSHCGCDQLRTPHDVSVRLWMPWVPCMISSQSRETINQHERPQSR